MRVVRVVLAAGLLCASGFAHDFGWVTGSALFGPLRFALHGAPSGWYLKSVRIGGGDVTDEPFLFPPRSVFHPHARFVIATNGARISGTIIDDADQTVSDYTVVVFPVDGSKRFAHSLFLTFARPSQDDSFEVAGLPPADYFVAAVETLDATAGAGEWQDPAVLDTLAREAKRVKLSEGELVDLTLRLRQWP